MKKYLWIAGAVLLIAYLVYPKRSISSMAEDEHHCIGYEVVERPGNFTIQDGPLAGLEAGTPDAASEHTCYGIAIPRSR